MKSSNIQKSIVRIAIVTALLLLIPVIGMQVSGEWQWTLFDFVFAGVLLFGTGLTYTLVARKGDTVAYRVAVGIAVMTALVLVWVNAAVGLIGNGDLDSPNALYFGVLAIGLVGAFMARFKPVGMAHALFVTALAQFLVPVLALVVWPPATTSWEPGIIQVFCLNAFFVALFVGSAVLFRRASIAESR